jgi:PEP-CTERM motif
MLFNIARRSLLFVSAITFFCTSSSAAGLSASATFTDVETSPGVFDYSLTLNNTGTTTIGTFWFSWIVGVGFMPTAPTSVSSPSGWSDILTNGGSAIQWTTTTDLLAAGDSLSGFEFVTTVTPAELLAAFPGPGLGTGDPTSTFFVYIATPLADPGSQSVATEAAAAGTVPEPGSAFLALLGIGAVLTAAKLRTKKGDTAS